MRKKRVTKVLALLISVTMLLALFTACAQDPTPDAPPPETGEETPAPEGDEQGEEGAQVDGEEVQAGGEEPVAPSNFQQAPMLDGLDLPPVDERLPVNPLVIEPWESIGTYGGTWRKQTTLGLRPHTMAAIGYYEGGGLVVWNQEMTEVIPNLVSSFEISDDATSITFTLRDGLRWSDGHPMTTADVLFWFDAFLSHPEVNPGWQTAALRIDRVEVVDEITFTFVYNDVNPLAIYGLAWHQWEPNFMPKHYLSQFHPDFDDDAEQRADDAGFDNWVGYFGDRRDRFINPDLPTMAPWVLTTDGAAATVLVYERNPFFWAVDTAGNQLPYIDSVLVSIVETDDIAMMAAAAGEIDMQMAVFSNTFENFPFLMEHADQGGYTVHTSEVPEPNIFSLFLNLAHPDPYIRELFQSADFRHALSYAINRELFIATHATVGPVSATPRNFVPAQGQFYDAEWEAANTTFDPDRANQMLDDLGLDNRNAAGTRLMANGEPLNIVIDVPSFVPFWNDFGLFYADNFSAVGINTVVNFLDPSLWDERKGANDFDATAMGSSGGFATLSLQEINDWTGYLGWGWTTAFQRGFIMNRSALAAGEDVEPMDVPAEIQRLWELGAEVAVEVDANRRAQLIDEIFQIHKDNLFVLGLSTRLPAIWIVGDNFRNVPTLVWDWPFGTGGTGRPSQYFFAD